MPVIAFLNQKGGSGKSTLALNTAAELASRGRRVLLVDGDPQQSATDWHASRHGVPCPFDLVTIDRPVLHQEVPELSRGYDYTIVDGPARDAALQRSAILASHLVAVPVQPSGLDLWASTRFLALLDLAEREVAHLTPEGRRVVLVTSRAASRGILSRDVRGALEGMGRPVLDGTTERLAYRESITAARTLHEHAAEPGARRVRESRVAARDEVAAFATNLIGA